MKDTKENKNLPVRNAKGTKTTTVKKEVKKEVVKTENKSMEKKNRTITGNVVSTLMQKTVVVSYTRKVPHKRYGKLMKVTKRIKADTNGMELTLGDLVTIEQTKPISKGKFFKVIRREEDKK